MCMDAAVTRTSGSASLGRVCTQNDWVALVWLLCPTWPLISQQGSRANGGSVRASADTQEDSRSLDSTPHNPSSHGLLTQPVNLQGQPRLKRCENSLHLSTTVHGKGNKCRDGESQGPKVIPPTLCAFFHTELSLWRLAVNLFPLSKTRVFQIIVISMLAIGNCRLFWL